MSKWVRRNKILLSSLALAFMFFQGGRRWKNLFRENSIEFMIFVAQWLMKKKVSEKEYPFISSNISQI